MSSDTVHLEVLDQLLNELDFKAQRSASLASQREGRTIPRHSPRHPFRVSCTIHFFLTGSLQNAIEMPGRTRNLSRGGVGLVVRRVFTPGEPIEVEMRVPDRPKTYMAGVVRFCRYVGHSYHEVGVKLIAAGDSPIFSNDPEMAQQMLVDFHESLKIM